MKIADSITLRAALGALGHSRPARNVYRTGEEWRRACWLAAGKPLEGVYDGDEIAKALFRELGGDKPARRVGRPADDCEGEEKLVVAVNMTREDKERARAIGGGNLSAGIRIALREVAK